MPINPNLGVNAGGLNSSGPMNRIWIMGNSTLNYSLLHYCAGKCDNNVKGKKYMERKRVD
jgi:hypothetical protein